MPAHPPSLDEKTPSLASGQSLILGTGEMAELIREFDWSKTSVGAVETWPDILITTVNLMLASRHPMFLFWGSELIQFYNDGYRPSILGGKHPGAVGQKGVECWPEIWHIIGPQIEAVMQRGEASWNVNQLVPIFRNGRIEEVFWTYGYSPVRAKDGTVQATLVVCTETTEQVLSVRRQQALLSIAVEPAAEAGSRERPLIPYLQSVVGELEENPSDIPFAALFLLGGGEVALAGATRAAGALSAPEHWPIQKVSDGRTPVALDRLPVDGGLVCHPWPEPVKRAFLLPLTLVPSGVQAVLVFGISPRLPFDQSYETFFQLVGVRIAMLLDAEMHRTERFRAAKRFQRLVEANPFGTIIGELDGPVRYINPSFRKSLGYSEAEIQSGKIRWVDINSPDYAERDKQAREQLLNTGFCDVFEKEYRAKDGSRIPILIGASALGPGDGNPEVAAFVTDLTPLRAAEEALRRANDELEKKVAERTQELEAEIADRKQMEFILRELTGRLLRMQDDERRRMARELHDHAGQTLVALIMNLAILKKAAGTHLPEVVSVAEESQQLSEDLSREIRTLSYLLHPPLLDEAGLNSALQWFVQGFTKRSKISVDLDLPKDLGRLPTEVELVIFRLVQEGLTNIHRHSGSSTARIRLSHAKDGVELEISDKGKGISLERQRQIKTAHVGVGVRGMEERVRQLRGSLKIDSGAAGTKVTVMLPVDSGIRAAG